MVDRVFVKRPLSVFTFSFGLVQISYHNVRHRSKEQREASDHQNLRPICLPQGFLARLICFVFAGSLGSISLELSLIELKFLLSFELFFPSEPFFLLFFELPRRFFLLITARIAFNSLLPRGEIRAGDLPNDSLTGTLDLELLFTTRGERAGTRVTCGHTRVTAWERFRTSRQASHQFLLGGWASTVPLVTGHIHHAQTTMTSGSYFESARRASLRMAGEGAGVITAGGPGPGAAALAGGTVQTQLGIIR